MLKTTLLLGLATWSLCLLAQPVISAKPQTPYITTEGSLQFLEFDFIVTGQKNGKYILQQIDLTVFDQNGRPQERRKLVDEGMVSNFGEFPKTKVKKDKSISLFNPFYFFGNDIELDRLLYQFKFTKGRETYALSTEVRPEEYSQKTELALPLSGQVIVDAGFDHFAHHRRMNTTHWGMRLLKISQNITRYAIDFAPCNDTGQIYQNTGDEVEDYFGFGQPVAAPAGGKVVELVRDLPDNEIEGKLAFGTVAFIKNPKLASGNYVVIDHLNGEVSLLAHLQQESITVELDQVVKAGDQIGLIGNSGDSTYPHLHYQLENEHSLNVQTYPALFSGINSLNNQKVSRPIFCNTGDIVFSR
ncbi:MAG: M23 family metallopeptidase [Cyclobacteriaceae bacterium]